MDERVPEDATSFHRIQIGTSCRIQAPPSSELARKLSELKDAYDAQLITKDEYEAKRKTLIAEL